VRKRDGERPEGGWKAHTHDFARASPPISRQFPRQRVDSGGDGAREATFRKGRGRDLEDPVNPIPDRLPMESVRCFAV